jgi:ribonuclease HI
MDIATGIVTLLGDVERLNSKHEIQQKWLRSHSWRVVAERLDSMLRALLNDEKEPDRRS